jgi:hypothetical protein
MKGTKVFRFEIVEGEHVGHHVVTDAFGIDFNGRDPETAGYCLDCRERVVIYEVGETKKEVEL